MKVMTLAGMVLVCLVSITGSRAAMVSGTVTDSMTLAPVESVLVQVKGIAYQTYTGVDGRFSINTSSSMTVPESPGIGNLTCVLPANRSVMVYGVDGALVNAGKAGYIPGLMAGLPDGLYIVKAKHIDRAFSAKIIKMAGNYCTGKLHAVSAKNAAAVTLVYLHPYYTSREIATQDGDQNVRAQLLMWFPDATNTGWQHTGVNLRTVKVGDSGPGWHAQLVGGNPVFYVTSDNAVVDGLDIPFMVKVFANNVTIKRSRIASGGYYCMFIGDPPTTYSGLRLVDVELDGKKDATNFVIAINASRNATFTRINCHSMGSSGPRLGTGTILEGSWLHDYVHGPDGHEAGISSNGNDENIIIRHNSISINTAGASSCIALYRDFGKPDNVLVEYNLLNGGNYGIMCGIQASNGSYPPVNNIRFIKNVFGREFFPECGRYGPYAQFSSTNGTGNVWSGNTWGDGAAATSTHRTGELIP
jgi:hypothetical protein